MYLFDLLFTLAPNIDVRIKFIGENKTYCFTTGKKKTGQIVAELSRNKKDGAKVHNIYALWHANELYIEAS